MPPIAPLYAWWQLRGVPRAPGADQRQCHRLGGCRRLLSRLERHRLDCKRGECPPLDTTARPDNATEHNGHPTSAWDTQRAHDHFGNDAGEWWVYRGVGCSGARCTRQMWRWDVECREGSSRTSEKLKGEKPHIELDEEGRRFCSWWWFVNVLRDVVVCVFTLDGRNSIRESTKTILLLNPLLPFPPKKKPHSTCISIVLVYDTLLLLDDAMCGILSIFRVGFGSVTFVWWPLPLDPIGWGHRGLGHQGGTGRNVGI